MGRSPLNDWQWKYPGSGHILELQDGTFAWCSAPAIDVDILCFRIEFALEHFEEMPTFWVIRFRMVDSERPQRALACFGYDPLSVSPDPMPPESRK